MSKKLFAIFNVNKPPSSSSVVSVCTNVIDDTDPDYTLCSSQGSIATVESIKGPEPETCDPGTLLTGPARLVLEASIKPIFFKCFEFIVYL